LGPDLRHSRREMERRLRAFAPDRADEHVSTHSVGYPNPGWPRRPLTEHPSIDTRCRPGSMPAGDSRVAGCLTIELLDNSVPSR